MKWFITILLVTLVLISLLDLSVAKKKNKKKCGFSDKNEWLGGVCVRCKKCDKDSGLSVKCRWFKDDCDDKECCCFNEDADIPKDCKHNRGRKNKKEEKKDDKGKDSDKCGFNKKDDWLGGKCVPCNECDNKHEYSEKCRWYKDDCAHKDAHCCCFPRNAELPSDCKHNRGKNNH